MSVLFGYVLVISIFLCNAQCQYPSWLQSKVWNDQIKGELTYQGSEMTGWSYSLYQHTIKEWTCFYTKDNLIISRSKENYRVLGTPIRAYICQSFQNESESVYHYTLMSDYDQTEGERVYLTGYIPVDSCMVCPRVDFTDQDSIIMSETKDVSSSPPIATSCNPCINHCDQPGTPLISVSTTPSLEFETPSYKIINYEDSDYDDEETNVEGIIIGVIGALLIVCVIVGLLFWFVRRGICVTDVLKTLYEEKNFHVT